MRAKVPVIRRDKKCPWADFWHRIRVGLIVAVLIVLLQHLAGCTT
jgi:hypothetical protein